MRKPLVIAVLTLLGSTAFAAGEVYRWKDANGVWNYSDQPHPGAELIRGTLCASNAVACNAGRPRRARRCPRAPRPTTPCP